MSGCGREDCAQITVGAADAEMTRALARRLGRLLAPGDFVALIGPLGAGKTSFVQGLAEGLRVEGAATSPTFVLMRLHRGPTPLCHVDAFRVSHADELLDLGLLDWAEDTVVALEWAERVPEALPRERIEVVIEYANGGRRLHIRGLGARPARIVRRLASNDDPGS